MKIDGRDLMWFREDDAGQLKAVSYGSTCTLDVTGEVQEKANDTDGNSREYVRGLISWTIRAQHMMCMSEDVSMIALLKSRTPMLISLSTVEPHEDGKMASDEVPDGRMVLTGRAFLTSYNVKANVNGKVTYEITMQGTGDIVETKRPGQDNEESTDMENNFINYRSDLVEIYHWSKNVEVCGFEFLYYTTGSRKVKKVVSYDGKNDNESVSYDMASKTFRIRLDNHGLQSGKLYVIRHFRFEDIEFEDGINDIYSNEYAGVVLYDGPMTGKNEFENESLLDTLTGVPSSPTVTKIEYTDPVVSLSYKGIDYNGTTASPTMSYNQKKTTYYSNGEKVEETISSGASVSYSIVSSIGATINSSSGVVSTTANSGTSQRTIGTITVNVTLNGKTATKDASLTQKGVPELCYYGFSTANSPTSISTAQSKTVSDGMTISITTDTTDKAKSQYVAFKAGSAYRVKSIVDSGNDGVDISTATIGGYTVYYMKADRGYVVDTNKFTIGK